MRTSFKTLSLFICMSLSEDASALCQAPGQAFLEEKLKESFNTHSGEKELKEIVSDPKNYTLREDIKSLDRRAKVANRIQLQEITVLSEEKFEQMIEGAGRGEDIADFPAEGASARVMPSKNSLAIEMNNLSKEDLDVLPPKVLEKLSNKVRIHYMYPYDKFDYFLSYDGRDLPMKKAFLKIQSDFEAACEETQRENQESKRKFGRSSGQ